MVTPYIDKAGMVARFGEKTLIDLTDRGSPYTGTIVDGVLAQAIASAGAIIDLHVGQQQALPLPAVPDALVEIAAALALSALYVTDAPDRVTGAFDQAMKTLRQIGDGTLGLAVAGGAGPAEAPANTVALEASDRAFGRDNMRSW